MACKNADWSQLGDGAEVEADGGGGAVGGGAMSRGGADIACRSPLRWWRRASRPERRGRRSAAGVSQGVQGRQCGDACRAPRCRSRPVVHQSERWPPRAWTRPGPCRSMDREEGARWEP